MRRWLYIISIVIMVVALILYFIYSSNLIEKLQEEKVVLNKSLNTLQVRFDNLLINYSFLVNKNFTVELNEPTYEQVKVSLGEMKGSKLEGNCLDKTKYVQDHFYNEGLQCYVVISNYRGGFGHSTVAFNTEIGWVYVEPETMTEIKIAKDMPYYIPMRAYEGPVGMTARDFVEKNIVTQLVILR